MHLTSQEIRSFQEGGLILKTGLVAANTVQQIRQECQNIHERMRQAPLAGVHVSWENEDAQDLVRQLMHSELISPTLNNLLRSDTILDIVEDLIGPDISLFHSKLLPKSRGSGAEVPWHQDYAYWQRETNQPLMVNCMLAIDPADRHNGCLEFLPGSHKWGLQEHERHQEAFGVFLPGRYYPRPESKALPMQPGDALFFTSLVIHGSAPNRSDADRWANTIAYNVTGNEMDQCREVLRGKSQSQ